MIGDVKMKGKEGCTGEENFYTAEIFALQCICKILNKRKERGKQRKWIWAGYSELYRSYYSLKKPKCAFPKENDSSGVQQQ